MTLSPFHALHPGAENRGRYLHCPAPRPRNLRLYTAAAGKTPVAASPVPAAVAPRLRQPLPSLFPIIHSLLIADRFNSSQRAASPHLPRCAPRRCALLPPPRLCAGRAAAPLRSTAPAAAARLALRRWRGCGALGRAGGAALRRRRSFKFAFFVFFGISVLILICTARSHSVPIMATLRIWADFKSFSFFL